MVPVYVRKSEWDDAKKLAPLLRRADRNEMRAVLGANACPEAALRYGIEVSYYPYTGLIDGEVACIFGAVPDAHEHIGSIWLMGSDALSDHPFAFLRRSKPWLARVFPPFTLLWNCVDKRNTLHIRWLRWMGFSFLREIPEYGEQKRPFLEFAKIRDTE